MLRIGEAAKQYEISNRTLRYWEEAGILKSNRADNDYRYFNDENVMRINQIVMLRKLRIPIADIESIFLADDCGAAIDTLTKHLASLKQDTDVNNMLIIIIEKIISHIKEIKNLDQIFSYLEAQNAVTDLKYDTASKNQLSERVILMSAERLSNVRIVRLPAMTVAAYRAESETPEEDCGKVFNKFVLDNTLHKRAGFRQFGFNNPSPSENSPVYGYEAWVSIPDDFDIPAPMEKKRFDGGLYASVSTQLNEIGERWELLSDWCNKNDKYEVDYSSQCFEECSMDFETFISTDNCSEQQLDLLMPIKLK
jgi:DNA-binding transcriptional MerR regulator/DNA gyrase inhibitor GyrI